MGQKTQRLQTSSLSLLCPHVLFPLLLLLSALTVPVAGQESASAKPAADPEIFWSFRQLARTTPATANDTPAAAIDRFIHAAQAKHEVAFAPEADRRTLCRRLYLDLIGLPPTPAEVDQFVNDASPQAVEKLVDHLLASPHYGERWGRQWLDVTGYADSNGYIRHDSPRPLAYRYRDYVIQSLNDDKPYDRFWLEQLAGDELVNYHSAQHLSPADVAALTATHYLRNAPDGTDNTEGNEIARTIERYAVLESQLQTTMSAMFGLTIDCAKCHDHKFDPIPQRDYYSLQSIFYPAFNVKSWVQPKERWIYAAGQADIAAWKQANQQADQEIAKLQKEYQAWLFEHRPPGQVQWRDDFSSASIAANWAPTAPGDSFAKEVPLTKLDGKDGPAARVDAERLSIIAGTAGDSRWLATQRKFDWTPEQLGGWIQVTFDLVESQGSDGQPAQRVGYYIALHDYDDNSDVKGGNLLLDGNPAGGANLDLDYPGSDQMGLGTIGTTGYLPGHNLGVRITRVGDNDYLLQHVADGVVESKDRHLTAEQLPDGAFGFELCCSRNFIVDNIVVESSPAQSSDSNNPQVAAAQAAFAKEKQARYQELTTAIAAAKARYVAEPAKLAWATDLSGTPPEVPLLTRGDYFRPGASVQPTGLSTLTDPDNSYEVPAAAADAKSTGRRLAFAKWATRPNSRAAALLARVQVDRIWRGHFGKGLVPSPENFGASGQPPTHPELLDSLAAELIDQGWHQKPIHRAIVLSQTYRQSSTAGNAAIEKDPTNTWYSRFPAHRLEAEQIRDSMLAVAAVLNPKAGGPAVDPVDRGNRQVVLATPQGAGPHEVDRRSIYIRYRRSEPLAMLRAFDQASPEPNCVARGSSTVVAQSLALLNGEFAVRMGQGLAKRVEQAAPSHTTDEQVQKAFQFAFSREANAAELEHCRQFLNTQTERRKASAADNAQHTALADLCRMLLATNEFLYLQ